MEIQRIAVGQRSINVEVYRPVHESAPGILLLHELFGLRDWYREDAADLARRGYLVYVPDLFSDGGALRYCIRAMVHEAGRKNRSDSEVNLEVHALLDALKADDGCNGRLGMLGACMTGGFVLQMAQRDDMQAPVLYHHSMGLEGAGVPKEESLSRIRLLQGHWSSADPFCPARRRDQLIETLGERVEAYTYHMPHGFRSTSRSMPGSKVVWQRTVDFFDRQLKQAPETTA